MWADEEDHDEEPRAQGPPAKRFGNETDDVYKTAPAYTQQAPSSRRRDDRRDDRRGGGGGSYGSHSSFSSTRDNRERGSKNYHVEPVPEEPPFSVYVSNVPYEMQDKECEEFLSSCGAIVDLKVNRWQDRARGATVEFAEKAGLLKALELDGNDLGGRPARVSVAHRPRGRDRSWSGGAQGMNHGTGRSKQYQERGGAAGRGGDLPSEPDAASLASRPKLNLKPRSAKPVDGGSSSSGGNSSSIFGSARPVDSSKKLEEVETKISEEKEKIKQEVEASAVGKASDSGDGFSRPKRAQREGGFKSTYNAGGRQEKQKPAPSADGFHVPKHVQRKEKDGDDAEESKGVETSVNAFDLLNMDDE